MCTYTVMCVCAYIYTHVCAYVILFSLRKETHMIGHNMNEPKGFRAKQNKPDTQKRKISHDINHMWNCKRKKKEETENKSWMGANGEMEAKGTCQEIGRTGMYKNHVQHECCHYCYRIYGNFVTVGRFRFFCHKRKSG